MKQNERRSFGGSTKSGAANHSAKAAARAGFERRKSAADKKASACTPGKKPDAQRKISPAPNVNPARLAAFRSLEKMKFGKYTNIEINTTLGRSDMSEADRRLYTILVYGVMERLITLDCSISAHSSRPVAQIDGETLCALRLGIYQLAFMDKIPDHAAVSESVELAGGAGGFVNAVLRSFIRAGKTVVIPEEFGGMRRMSAEFSVPEDLCRDFVEWYGEETAKKIFASFFEHKKVSLRVNTLKISVAEAAKLLSGNASTIAPDTVVIDSLSSDARDGIGKGLWFVQDEASVYAASVLGAKSGETIVDCCAAPGGKSFSAAIDMENNGRVYSFDLHENKLSLIKNGASKLGLSIIEAKRCDAREPVETLVGSVDRVLCDAPCSGLGVIGKKPDIKYKGAETVKRLPQIQYDVLCGASRYVKRGGILVYSTCTLNPNENGGVTGKFLSENPDFELYPFETPSGAAEGEVTLLPNETGTDGFYICRMKRMETQSDRK